MGDRLTLHNIFIDILNTRGNVESRVYFQPPSSVTMKYPAIVYKLEDIDAKFANNRTYSLKKQYLVTVIDANPDSLIINEIMALPYCRFNRRYMANNLNHDVVTLYY